MAEAGYRRIYTIRKPLAHKNFLEVTFPYDFIEREARKREMTVEQFIQDFAVQVEFDSSPTAVYTIVPKQQQTAPSGR